jgi:hypothetical protein
MELNSSEFSNKQKDEHKKLKKECRVELIERGMESDKNVNFSSEYLYKITMDVEVKSTQKTNAFITEQKAHGNTYKLVLEGTSGRLFMQSRTFSLNAAIELLTSYCSRFFCIGNVRVEEWNDEK